MYKLVKNLILFCTINLLLSNSLSLFDNGDDTWDVGYISDSDIGGFQFNVDGASILSAEGGDAQANGFMISTSSTTALGFSLTGASVAAGEGVLTVLTLDGSATGLSGIVVSSTLGEGLDFPTEYTYEGSSGDVEGCMDETACNYNPEATIDEGSCIFAEENFDCEGNCTLEVDCGGICGGDAYIDNCNQCMCGSNFGPDSSECDDDDECEQGCDDQWYSDIDAMPVEVECWDGSFVCDEECPEEPSNMYYSVTLDDTGESQLTIFSDLITSLSAGDEIGVFDADGITTFDDQNLDDCANEIGELLVGAGVWDGSQLNIVSTGSVDLCSFSGPQLPGFVEGNDIMVKIWKADEQVEYETFLTWNVGNGVFGEPLNQVSEITLVDPNACFDDNDAVSAFGDCAGAVAALGCEFLFAGSPISEYCPETCDECEEEEVEGCMDESACNYDPLATISSECDFESCAGCMDVDACNYDPLAIIPSECEFPEENFDCEGNCIVEIDCLGDCGGNAADLGCGCDLAAPDAGGCCADGLGPNGEVQDCSGECGGDAVVDECGECNGDGIDDGACDCDGNVEDCAGDCGGTVEVDECGDCGGDGIDDGACDCDGNVDLGCGCGDPGFTCSDGSIVCDEDECPDDTPALFAHEQSLLQAFYFFNTVLIDGENVATDDWVGAFNGDICVGARKWDTSECGGGVCDIPAMGDSGDDYTEGYMNPGDIPTFKIYDFSEDLYYDATPIPYSDSEDGDTEVCEWANFGFCSLDVLSYGDAPVDIQGCMDDIACNYNSEATIDDGSCEYPEENFDCDGNCIAEIDCAGDCGGDAVIDECGECGGEGLNADGCCGEEVPDCNNECGGTTEIDECGECGGNGIDEGACDCDGNVEDCAGDCGGTALEDECGICDGDGIVEPACDCDGTLPVIYCVDNDGDGLGNPDNQQEFCEPPPGWVVDCSDDSDECEGVVDLCGVCDGGNADLDCNHICFGPAAEDECGVCEGDSSSCSDCFGVPNGSAVDLGCGCGLPGPSGCDNQCFSTAVDLGCGCGESGPSGCDNVCESTAIYDCAGVCGGDSVEDECGVCGGNDSSCADCFGIPNGDAIDLGCGCDLPGPSGCDNICESTALYDCAGVCGGDNVEDCNGVCGGDAVVDDCGVCDGGNADQDCAGECFGDSVEDCNGDCGGSAVIDACGLCGGGNTDCAPSIVGIDDIPSDQGGFGLLTFNASPADTDTLDSRSESYYIEIFDQSLNSWVAIPSSGAAYGHDQYFHTVAAVTQTLGGSEEWQYRVVASMDEGTWASGLYSFGSIDNLAPDFTGNITASWNDDSKVISVTWDEVDAPDLDYYNISIGQDCNFTETVNVGLDTDYLFSDISEDTNYCFTVNAVDIHGNEGLASGIASEDSGTLSIEDSMIPESFMLYSPYPNPFNPSTTIKFDISQTSNINIGVYDMNGNFVDQILSQTMVPGNYEVLWDAENLPSGVYFIHMNTYREVFTEKVLLIK